VATHLGTSTHVGPIGAETRQRSDSKTAHIAEPIARTAGWGGPCPARGAAGDKPTASAASGQNTLASADWNNVGGARAGATATTRAGTGTDNSSGQGNGAYQRPARSAKANASEDVKDSASHYRIGHIGCAADRARNHRPRSNTAGPQCHPDAALLGIGPSVSCDFDH
jgi:hypothetical protein